MRLPTHPALVPALCVGLASLAACRSNGGTDPMGADDAGPLEADAGTPEVPLRVALDAGPARPSSAAVEDAPPLPYATISRRCVAGEQRYFAVLSEDPPDCGAHARAVVEGGDAGLVPIELPGAAGASDVLFMATGTVCAEDGCRERELELAFPAFADGAPVVGTFAFDTADDRLTGRVQPVWCDYDTIVPPPEGDTPVRGLRIDTVSINQGIRTVLGPDGPTLDPELEFDPVVVAGRPGLLRVTVEPVEGEWAPREVLARLDLGDAGLREVRQTIAGPSDLGDRGTTFDFLLTGEDVSRGRTWAVSLWEIAACAETRGTPDGARRPSEGAAPLGAQDPAGALDVVIVPMRFTADGSDRLPDTSDEALREYAERMLRNYPVAEVNASFREPVDLDVNVTRTGNWSAFLFACQQVRSADAPDDDTYYYCITNPSDSFGTYCTGGCILGLGTLPSDDQVSLRGSVGVGFPGYAPDTFVHEVGHNHGRRHTPCGNPAGVDPEYPRAGARIGDWGWDIVDEALVDPARARDFMSYCGPEWVSDYTFWALFERHKKVETAIAPAFAGLLRPWRTAFVEPDGSLVWGGWTDPRIDAGGDPVAASWVGPGGQRVPVAASFAAFDHQDGGFLSIEDPGIAEGGGTIEAPGFGTIPW